MDADMFRPPIHRGMQVLDRAFFHKHIPTSAARVLENRHVSRVRTELERSKDILVLPRFSTVKPDPITAEGGRRCVLLRPQVDEQGQPWAWSQTVEELQNARMIEMIPYVIELDYKYWSYHDIAKAVLPNAETEDFPSSFQVIGHVAHLNLRDEFLDYKGIIAQLLLDKNPGIKTVINKIDDVGEESEYRTFKYELLAGENDLNVEVKEQDCFFNFDYSKVYWNSRLNTEHERMVGLFREGEAICDVMAGIGPFAIPAGKRKIFVWANDKNPESVKHLEHGIKRNKTGDWVRPSNVDGHHFIKQATRDLASSVTEISARVTIDEAPGKATGKKKTQYIEKTYRAPKTFSHYIMNLPALAMDFLPDYIGLYNGIAGLPEGLQMPMVHCYCFETKSDDNVQETHRICEEISKRIGHPITPGTSDMTVHDVRDVAPKKRMFCASFRLPVEVAFRRSNSGI